MATTDAGVTLTLTQLERAILIGGLTLLIKSTQRQFTSLTQNGRHETAAAANRELAEMNKVLAKIRV